MMKSREATINQSLLMAKSMWHDHFDGWVRQAGPMPVGAVPSEQAPKAEIRAQEVQYHEKKMRIPSFSFYFLVTCIHLVRVSGQFQKNWLKSKWDCWNGIQWDLTTILMVTLLIVVATTRQVSEATEMPAPAPAPEAMEWGFTPNILTTISPEYAVIHIYETNYINMNIQYQSWYEINYINMNTQYQS